MAMPPERWQSSTAPVNAKAIGRSLVKSRRRRGFELLERLDNSAAENLVTLIEDSGLAGTECPLSCPKVNADARTGQW